MTDFVEHHPSENPHLEFDIRLECSRCRNAFHPPRKWDGQNYLQWIDEARRAAHDQGWMISPMWGFALCPSCTHSLLLEVLIDAFAREIQRSE